MLALSCHGDKAKPALVMLHGFLGNQADWQDIIVHLTEHFYCVCVDLPGHGKSPSISLPTPGFKQIVEQIQIAIDSLTIEKYHLLGYSLGGRIALHLARDHTDKLLSLCVESCHPGLETTEDKWLRAQNDLDWSHKLANLPLDEFLSQWYQQGVFAELSSETRQQLIDKRSHNSKAGLLSIYLASSLAQQANLWDQPNLIKIPCHYIVGSDDNKFLALATRWQQGSPIKVHTVKQAGHNVHLAAPIEYSRKLIQLLSEGKL
ncbi:2-succinyl-6-hydroxy-2,4-cyclohexadiene-1-carboxylate synthase [Shewanella sp. D64]|uniref:2-succinyl-6-hydroxy-2, 4-cyclohexadiene-1-carboxylate synthase n=1 Tax=unclassified Shewanella TaxID=196818 RepID=UPI0022BA17D7|nr:MULTISPECIES: 2-succinyl-6-hydroxy-2,4-cyclohexadiene-1-carboxylate synthase [unclassified Shewanella]MEC4728743.1 2-succinyl-6-hydroxy-2,4-cyclohexadiene-1-carboxylate synthase [Shewanella sp. D64]MEC4740612.1 2-succinyl-6-hydroxy-2,4-cyclohexadiene-1-carboxylate synthase [Shewanella sp. E94]WBJ95127.1 2-succinyl-6-hydroxy-2,4-cyclohexadiene-1-carboxylate synthase [Shewanella sp. MTB7]